MTRARTAQKNPVGHSYRFRAKRRRALGLTETVPDTKTPLAASAGAIDPSPEGASESKEEGKEQEEDDDEETKEETKNEEGKEQEEGESKDDGGDGETDDSTLKKASKVSSEIGAKDQQESTSFGLGK